MLICAIIWILDSFILGRITQKKKLSESSNFTCRNICYAIIVVGSVYIDTNILQVGELYFTLAMQFTKFCLICFFRDKEAVRKNI
jgi:hypothetical protein